MPRVAALLDVMQVSEITKVLAPDTFERPIYAGNAIQTVQSVDPRRVITVRTAAFQATPAGGNAEIAPVAAGRQAPASRPSRANRWPGPIVPNWRRRGSSYPAGRAMQSAENFAKYIEPVADRLNAAVGASRAAVDAGFAPNDLQVGQTGKVVAPELYIAVGISGAIQHLAGMKDSKVIVAINKDEEAPIFQVADYGLVGDLFTHLARARAGTWQVAQIAGPRVGRGAIIAYDRRRTRGSGGGYDVCNRKDRHYRRWPDGQRHRPCGRLAGFDVVLNDVTEERVHAGLATIHGNMARQISKNQISEEHRKAALARITASSDYADFSDCDLVIEAATENEEIKRKIFAKLCPIARPDAILASNTSSISITRLASATDRPEKFIGIHFMNPVPVMQLVELIRGIATDDTTFEASKAFIEKLGKTSTVSEDFPAFIVNRILLPMINEAIYTLYEGVGSVEAIDTAMKLGANHPMGPLQLADFIGLDTCLSVMQVLHEGLADTKYRPCPLLVKYVEAGWLGRKTKRGFYDYRSGTPVPTR